MEGYYDFFSILSGFVGVTVLCTVAWPGIYEILIKKFEKSPSNFNKDYLSNIAIVAHADMYANDIEPLKKLDVGAFVKQ